MSTSHVLAASPTEHATDPRYSVLVAATPDEIRAAQRLRHLVFAEELGAVLHSATPGLDIDDFDRHCDHLLVRDDRSGEVVGTYRMLPPHRAVEAGRLYSETEFDLTELTPLRDAIVETGRSCVHPDHRNGAVINLMWTGIARHLHLHGHRWLAGCASVSLSDGGAAAASVWSVVRDGRHAPRVGAADRRDPRAGGRGRGGPGRACPRRGSPRDGHRDRGRHHRPGGRRGRDSGPPPRPSPRAHPPPRPRPRPGPRPGPRPRPRPPP